MYSLHADEWAQLIGCGWVVVITQMPAGLRDPHDLNGRMVRIDGARYIVTSVETPMPAPSRDVTPALPFTLLVLPAPRRSLRDLLNFRRPQQESVR
jgi:hypothetical protein